MLPSILLRVYSLLALHRIILNRTRFRLMLIRVGRPLVRVLSASVLHIVVIRVPILLQVPIIPIARILRLRLSNLILLRLLIIGPSAYYMP